MQTETRFFVATLAFALGALLAPHGAEAQGVPNDQRASVFASQPRPLGGIQLTAQQRAAIAADWEQRKSSFAAVTQRWRTAEGVTDVDRAALREFVKERNAVVRAILTSAQRDELDRNLARITELRRQRAVELRRVP